MGTPSQLFTSFLKSGLLFKGKNWLLFKENFHLVEKNISFQKRPFSEGDQVCRKANRKSQKLPPIEIMA